MHVQTCTGTSDHIPIMFIALVDQIASLYGISNFGYHVNTCIPNLET